MAKKKAEAGESRKGTGKDEKGFEELMERLEEIASKLESGEMPLEKAIEAYEEGVRCYKDCHRILAAAEKTVELLTRKADGSVAAEPLDEAEEDGGEGDSSKDDPEDAGSSLF